MTLPNRKTPHVALIAGAVIGYCSALLIEFGDDWFGADVPVGAVLLNMAVFGAIIRLHHADDRLRPAAAALPED